MKTKFATVCGVLGCTNESTVWFIRNITLNHRKLDVNIAVCNKHANGQKPRESVVK